MLLQYNVLRRCTAAFGLRQCRLAWWIQRFDAGDGVLLPARDEKKEAQRLLFSNSGAGKESRTLDLNLGKVALYQLSYSRVEARL